ncbi:MAG: cytochrome c oxidase, subunit [Prosthecobacter sp.]|nr:cytochrome c oxidase, subunit [Prosthecobacter sp.]
MLTIRTATPSLNFDARNVIPESHPTLISMHVLAAAYQHMLDAASNKSHSISGLWWFYFAVLLGVFLLVVMALLGAAVISWKRGEREPHTRLQELKSTRERNVSITVTAALIVTALTLVTLLLMDFTLQRRWSEPAPKDAMPVTITGHQWWWEVRFENADPSQVVTTANVVHLPLGKPVRFDLGSTDVIHSFWIPSLDGKKDMIPGYSSGLWFVPERAGTYEGRCAEFCGLQHAQMRLTIVVEPPEAFAAWLDTQRKSAPEPATETQKRGRDVFMRGTCVLCHTIDGTLARSMVGPSLTHFASRPYLGAGAIPNSREHLAAWVLDPQAHKPGVRMPQNNLTAQDLDPLLDYLETLR